MVERIEYQHAQLVEIKVGRWTARVVIRDAENVPHEYVFSADSGDTYGDGLYFATAEEYGEHLKRGGW